MFDDDRLFHPVGFASKIAADARDALTHLVEKLGELPGFTGPAPRGRAAGAPGGARNGNRCERH